MPIEWNQIKMSDIQRNILTSGKEGVSAADALDARNAAYQAGKSHDAARFLKGLLSLGINEIWRFANYQSYESDKARIVNCVKDGYKALEPKLGTTKMTIAFHDPGTGNDHLNSQITSEPHVGHSTDKVQLMETKAKIVRNPDESGLVTFAGKDDDGIVIKDCEEARRNLEISMMKEAKRFGKNFVMGILNGYKKPALANAKSSNAGMLHFGDGDTKGTVGQRRAGLSVNIYAAQSDEKCNSFEANLQDQTVST